MFQTDGTGVTELCTLGDCVVVAEALTGVFVESSRRPDDWVWLDLDEWEKFLKEVKEGKYDRA